MSERFSMPSPETNQERKSLAAFAEELGIKDASLEDVIAHCRQLIASLEETPPTNIDYSRKQEAVTFLQNSTTMPKEVEAALWPKSEDVDDSEKELPMGFSGEQLSEIGTYLGVEITSVHDAIKHINARQDFLMRPDQSDYLADAPDVFDRFIKEYDIKGF